MSFSLTNSRYNYLFPYIFLILFNLTSASSTLFTDWSQWDYYTTFSILCGSIIAAGGGLGGGGVFVPIYILLAGLSTKKAAALSQATIFGGSIVNLIMNFKYTHPTRKHRPLPDLQTLLIFEPMLLGGTVIGVLMNVTFPDPLILALLIIILTYATFRTVRRGHRMWKLENEYRLKLSQYENSEIIENLDANASSVKSSISTSPSSRTLDLDNRIQDDTYYNYKDFMPSFYKRIRQKYLTFGSQHDPHEYESLLDKTSINESEKLYGSRMPSNIEKFDFEDKKYQSIAQACGMQLDDDIEKLRRLEPYVAAETQIIKPMGIMLLIWCIVSLFAIAKKDFGVALCSPIYWALEFGVFPFLFAITGYIAYKTMKEYKTKTLLGYQPATDPKNVPPTWSDIRWTNYNVTIYPLIAGIAGLLGGLLGIGGGMIVSPLLMELGVEPSVAAATSALAVLVTSSSATLQFLLLGMLEIDFMFFFMAVGIVGTFIGQTGVNYTVEKYGRKSIIVFSVAMIIGGAVILMGYDGIVDIINGDTSMAFSSLCS